MGSGTTLLGLQIVQRFATSGVIDESCLLFPAAASLHVEAISRHASIRDYEASLFARSDWDAVVAREEMQTLYRARARQVAGPVVDKAANAHLHRLRFLSECYAEAAMLVIFRDPVANVEGFRRKWPTFGRDSLDENIRFYRDLHERFLAAREDWRGPCLLINYESLVSDPEATLALIRGRLGLTSSDTTRVLRERPNVPGQGIRNVEQGRIQIVADANEHALKGLESEQAMQIRDRLGGLYETLLREADNT